MPLTPTHIIAVLPMWPLRRWMPFPALAIGAMVPDISLFFPIVDYAQTHSPIGVFTVCLPIGLAFFMLFETVFRLPLVALLPAWFQRRVEASPQIPSIPSVGKQALFYTGVIIAIAIGAGTHQVWDAFTHKGRWGTKLLPFLNASASIAGYAIPGYKLFQYGSTILGLPFLATFALNLLRRVHPNDSLSASGPANLKVGAVIAMCITPIFVASYAVATQASPYKALGLTVRLSGALALVICAVYCSVFQLVANGPRKT